MENFSYEVSIQRGQASVLMEIRSNYSGRDIEPFAAKFGVYEHQEEVLFLKGSVFHLVRAIMQQGKPYLILEEER